MLKGVPVVEKSVEVGLSVILLRASSEMVILVYLLALKISSILYLNVKLENG
jgi:hypothetical protein